MEPTTILGPLSQIFSKIGERLYDHLAAEHGVRIELAPGVYSISGQQGEALVVTTYNSTSRPQMVNSVFLSLSHNAGIMMIPWPSPGFPAPPQLVTETQNFAYLFPVDAVQDFLRKRRSETGKHIYITGAGVNLASGRRVHVRKRVDLPDPIPSAS